ncbi:monovalent cation/H(+) antiporter subunit G [Terricaulis silvestris]|uniref:Multiple resistance and pH homeostasis protein G n=1 Tax=Terricaulis silvestris TaxID=2686094 RepID=A0A6I6MK56_9CAUL|nr:monovalent cation/H(+) antiporter subunit G [Terricaulis silvestris]QGZ95610.1 Multiple resistance and pH homeostasis protein G [Terricaulis silvestris]
MEQASILELVRYALGGVAVLIGLVFMLGGTLGVLRFPDFYTRLHAARVSDAVGATILVLGLALCAADGATMLRLLLLAALIAALGPTLSHLLANAAHAAGLAPTVGRYTAPRPGAKPPESRQ